MTRIGEYTFVVTDLLSGNVVSEVALESFYWDEIYNRPGGGLATARFDEDTTTPEIFADWKHALWAIQQGTIIWGGIIGKVQGRGRSHVASIPVHGFFSYFQSRQLRNAQGMTHGSLVRTSDIEWRSVDMYHIVEDMIDHCKSFTNGDINVDIEYDALRGELITLIYRTFQVKNIGTAIQELAARQNGLRFRQVYSYEGNAPRCNIKLEASHPTTLGQVLLYQPEYRGTRTTTLVHALAVNNTAQAHASTPGINVTNDLDVRFSFDADDWTPAFDETLIAQWDETGNQRGWIVRLLPTGQIRLVWSTDGSDVLTYTSANSVSFTSGIGTIRAAIDVDNGSGDYVVTLEESTDGGVTWTSLDGDPYTSSFGETY